MSWISWFIGFLGLWDFFGFPELSGNLGFHGFYHSLFALIHFLPENILIIGENSMGIELLKMESEETNNSKKKFSPFSVDSLLATKVKKQQAEHQNNNQIVDLSVKKEELEESDDIEDYEEDCDLEAEEESEDNESEKQTVLTPNPRFPLTLPLPTPTSGFFNPMAPWMPQFRSPLNPFLTSNYAISNILES